MNTFGFTKNKPCCDTEITMSKKLYEDYKSIIEDDKGDMVKCRDCNSMYDVKEMVEFYYICKWNR